jgi:hypothetical protein
MIRLPSPHGTVPVQVSVLATIVLGLFGARIMTAERGAPASRSAISSTEAAAETGTRVRFELVSTRRAGATGAPRTDVTDNVAVGTVVEHTLSAGTPTSPDLCDIGTLAGPDPSQAYYLWQVSAQVRSVSTTQTSLDVRWRRTGPGSESLASEDDTQSVTLEAGEVRLLDYVRDRTGLSRCANVQLQVRADPIPRPGTQPTLAYDVWLVHEGSREPRVVHQTLAAPSGRPVNLDLAPLSWSPDGRTSVVESPSSRVTMKVRGAITATLRADGTLDVSVRAVRAVSWRENEVRGEGREEYRGAVGETVSLLFPNARGQDGDVDLSALFAGTRTSLYVRVVRRD